MLDIVPPSGICFHYSGAASFATAAHPMPDFVESFAGGGMARAGAGAYLALPVRQRF